MYFHGNSIPHRKATLRETREDMTPSVATKVTLKDYIANRSPGYGIVTSTLRMGFILVEETYRNGCPRGKGWFVDGMKDGKWIYYHPTGTLSEIQYWDRGSKTGVWEIYNDAGLLVSEVRHE